MLTTLTLITLLLAPYLTGTVAHQRRPSNRFQLTAISAAKRQSRLECWQLSRPEFVSNSTNEDISGVNIELLGPIDNVAIVIVPPEIDVGEHRDRVEYVAVLTGLLHISIPNTTQELWLGPGQTKLMLATDTSLVSDLGHESTFPTSQQTTAVQIQPVGGVVPDHVVLYDGPCRLGSS
ncbi:MAG: hypothetical protein M1826_005361 [Phylliscum demangeonii]|nr:MAG: hypothetical protein M1826_005361 [Phylliscum demangeonii]